MAFELKFDPRTIEHLGVKMYSTLPPALSELISNAYDADANHIKIHFNERQGKPVSIVIEDNGDGMSSTDIQDRFLVIGRNRRQDDGDTPSSRFGRLPTGKKGLGKLALFGLADQIIVDTIQESKQNRFELNWKTLIDASGGVYSPQVELLDFGTEKSDGTTITLKKLKRKSSFDLVAIADSLSKIFIVDENFKITLSKEGEDEVEVTNARRYDQIENEFMWLKDDVECAGFEFSESVNFKFFTSKTPIPPNSGLRGITIFSRGKLVNMPEFFSSSTSSHFFQYLTGYIEADFVDLLPEDVISTNRQSINWDQDDMSEFRNWLTDIVSKVNRSWRDKRKDKKDKDFQMKTGINQKEWFSKLPNEIKESATVIINTLSNDEGVDESFNPVVTALHEIIPEYPLLHWRHLHEKIRERVEVYYQNEQYAEAADQATKVYAHIAREISGQEVDGTKVAGLFGGSSPAILVADTSTESGTNIQEGQGHLTRGVMAGFRNPINHAPIDVLVPGTFTELDCLNILSLISYLTTRMDYQVEASAE